MLVCTIGDLLLDVIVRLDAPIAPDTDTDARTSVGPGGQAANVAAWVAALGDRARFVGKRARDPAGRVIADGLRERGVEVAGPEVEAGTGTIVSLSQGDGTRSMLSDRGVAPSFAPDELDPAWLEGCDWLHVPVYSLAREPLRSTAVAAAALAPRVSVDLSSTAAIEEMGVDVLDGLLRDLDPELVLASEAEAALLGSITAETVVIHSRDGCVVHDRAGTHEHAAEPVEVVDATGAGDAFAAGFLLGGYEMALRAGARCVAQMGAMPAWR
jgi:sugar/nucleoside kinase (ribokinase family)